MDKKFTAYEAWLSAHMSTATRCARTTLTQRSPTGEGILKKVRGDKSTSEIAAAT